MLSKTFLRFAMVGAVNTLLGISVFPVLFWSVGDRVNVNVILTISYVVCTVFAFTMHKKVTFGSGGRMHSEGMKFVAVTAVLWALNVALLNLILHFFTVNTVVVQTLIAVSLQLGNYVVLKRFVFAGARVKTSPTEGEPL